MRCRARDASSELRGCSYLQLIVLLRVLGVLIVLIVRLGVARSTYSSYSRNPAFTKMNTICGVVITNHARPQPTNPAPTT